MVESWEVIGETCGADDDDAGDVVGDDDDVGEFWYWIFRTHAGVKEMKTFRKNKARWMQGLT